MKRRIYRKQKNALNNIVITMIIFSVKKSNAVYAWYIYNIGIKRICAIIQLTRDDYYYIVIIIIIIILYAFSEIDFVRAASTLAQLFPRQRIFDPWVPSQLIQPRFCLRPHPTTHTHTHPLYSTYTPTFGGINLFYFSSEQDDDNRFRRRRPW